MRVGAYVPEIGPHWGGAYVFVREVLAGLGETLAGHEFHVLSPGEPPQDLSTNLPWERLRGASDGVEGLDDEVVRLAIDLVWFLTPGHAPIRAPYFATVWDLEHRNRPEFPEVSVSGWTWEERESHYRETLPRAASVLVGSEEGRRQIERYYGVPTDHVAVVPYPVPRFSDKELAGGDELDGLGVRPPYLFYPAQTWPHKNHAVLIHALKMLDEGEGLQVQLVLSGTDKGNLEHILGLAAELGVRDRVLWLGFVPRRTLASLYRRALALVFPSFFGPDNLPPLEAFSLGCPVVTAALPGTAELYDEAALLVDPRHEAEWAAAAVKLLRQPRLRDTMVERGLTFSLSRSSVAYVERVAALLDAFEPLRRCWSRKRRFVHL